MQVLFFAEDDDDNPDKVSTTRSIESSTNGTNTPEPPRQSGDEEDGPSSPLLGGDADSSKENVLKNIFTSLSCRRDTSLTGEPEPQHATMKHVRLLDRVEPVKRDDQYS